MTVAHNVLELMESSATSYPEHVAVQDETTELTYAQLLKASKVAGTVLLGQGGVTGRPVVIWLEKSVKTLVSFMGVLYAGGHYVPLDPNAPDNRVTSMASTLGNPVVIVDAANAERAQALLPGCHVMMVDQLFQDAITPDQDQLDSVRRAVLDIDPAYVLFTSGSTGAPKGVAVSHRAIIDFIGIFVDEFGFTHEDIFANQAPFDFDVSVKDIYSSMMVGATLAIVPRPLFSQPAALIDYVNATNATVMIWAVAALCLVSSLHGLDYTGLPTVRKVLFSGEVMPMHHLSIWMGRLPEALFVNLYGPTEITCNCTFHVVERDRDYPQGLPLGVAFANRQIMLLDEEDRLVTAPDQQGEICVRGTSVALGYYGAEEQTAKAFVRNPLQAAYPQTVYRTGDLGAFTADGDLFFCGRKDNQIKHLGHRIELEEIDAAFERQAGVTRCRSAFDPERSRIHAFYEGDATEADLLARAQESLPVFMIPNSLNKVDSMPLTKNGKVDRKVMLQTYLEEKQRQKEARRAARKAAKAKEASRD